MRTTENAAGLVNWKPAERRHRSGLVTWSQVGARTWKDPSLLRHPA
jgi:hypothetical protein